jgi:hypothetical protein
MQSPSDEEVNFRKVTQSEILLIAVVVLLSVAAILWNWSGDAKSDKHGGMVAVHHKGKLLERVGLEKDRIVVLPDGEMKIEVKDSKVRVAWSNCPNQLCVNTGWIKTAGEIIVCVPNKVLIEIEAPDGPALDAVVR